MRYLIGGLTLVLLAAIGGAYFLLPTLVDESRLERRVATAIAEWSGLAVSIEGPVEINLLPRPLVTLVGPRLGVASDASGLAADRLDLDVALLPLLAGRLEVANASLVRPRIWGELPPGKMLDILLDRLAAALVAGDGALPIRTISVVDGTLARAAAAPPLIERISGTIERDATTGTSSLLATGDVRGPSSTIPLRLEGQVGRTMPGRPIPLQLALHLADSTAVDGLSFRGQAQHEAARSTLDGRVEVAASRTIDLLSRLSLPFSAMVPGASAATGGPWSLAADLTLERTGDATALRLDEAYVAMGVQRLAGDVEVRTGAEPFLAVELAGERLRLPDALSSDPDELGTLLGLLPAATTGRIALTIDALDWRGQKFRQVSLDLALDGTGRARIEGARAVLPGPGDVAFSGSLAGIGGSAAPRLTGELALAVQDPAEPFSAVLPPPEMLRRSTTLALDAALDWAAGEVTMRNFDLRLDALQALGGLAWRAGDEGQRPTLALRAQIDRLAIDDILDVTAPSAALEDWLGFVAGTDLALDLAVERASLGDARLGRLNLAAEAEAARLRIGRLSLADIAGSALAIDGTIDAKSREFDLDIALDVASLPRLLRLAEQPAPPALALLGPLNLRADFAGDRTRAGIEARLEADLLEATAEAELVDWPGNRASGDISLVLDGSDAASLLRQLLAMPVTSPLLDGALTGVLELTLEQGVPTKALLDLALGRVALDLALTQQEEPRLELGIGPLDLATTAQLYTLSTPLLGLVPGPPDRWLGYWPSQPLDWGWLEQPRRRLSLRVVPVDPALPPVHVDGEINNGTLTIPAFSWQGPEGHVAGAMALERQPAGGVELALDVALEDLNAADVVAAIGAESAALAGTLDLKARLRSSGHSIRQLVGGLDGTVDLVLSDGRLGAMPADAVTPGSGPRSLAPEPSAASTDSASSQPLPSFEIERLQAELAVERGVVQPAQRDITAVTPTLPRSITGYADLLAWIIDLEVALATPGDRPEAGWRLFGPLTDPSHLPRSSSRD